MKTCFVFFIALLACRQSPIPFSNVQFAVGNAEIVARYQEMLKATASTLKTTHQHYVICGYAAHGEGTAPDNLRISKDRAQAVLNFLVSEGVSGEQLSIKFYGESHPIGDNSTENGRALNRRVEFRLRR
jgi:OOP family OmpA-OmpF porin